MEMCPLTGREPEVVGAEGSLEMDQRAHGAAGHAEARSQSTSPIPALLLLQCPPRGSSVQSHCHLRVWNWVPNGPGREPAIVLS